MKPFLKKCIQNHIVNSVFREVDWHGSLNKMFMYTLSNAPNVTVNEMPYDGTQAINMYSMFGNFECEIFLNLSDGGFVLSGDIGITKKNYPTISKGPFWIVSQYGE